MIIMTRILVCLDCHSVWVLHSVAMHTRSTTGWWHHIFPYFSKWSLHNWWKIVQCYMYFYNLQSDYRTIDRRSFDNTYIFIYRTLQLDRW